MKVTVDDLSPVLRQLHVEIPWEDVEKEIEKRYDELRRSARPLRGFRPGKAPRWLLEQQFGPLVEAEVSRRLMSDSLIAAFEEKKLIPVAPPELDPGEVKRGEPFRFAVKVEIRPPVADLVYEGLEVERPIARVTDEIVAKELERMREEMASLRSPEVIRPSRKGDVVVIDYEVFKGTSTTPDGSRTDQEVEVGSGALLDEVEAALVGASAGEERTAFVRFPDDHPRPEMRGQVLTFKIKVKDVREKVLPKLDDDFAKDAGGHASFDELREAVRSRLEAGSKAASDKAARDRVVDALCERNPVEVPAAMIEAQRSQTRAELAMLFGQSVEDLKLSEDQEGRIRQQAERTVRAGLLLAEVASKAGVEVSDEDLEARLSVIAQSSGNPLPKVKAELGKGDRLEHLRSSMLQDKVLDLLISKAKVTDKLVESVVEDEEALAAAEPGGVPEPATAEAAPQEEKP